MSQMISVPYYKLLYPVCLFRIFHQRKEKERTAEALLYKRKKKMTIVNVI